MPGPLSLTESCSCRSTRTARMAIRPALAFFAIPCRTAFSTKGCKPMCGTVAGRISGPASISTRSRSGNLTCSDGKVEPDVFQFAVERHLLVVDIAQHRAQQVAEAAQRFLRFLPALLPHQHHDRVQRVEQEMRLKLHLERAQAGARDLRPQLRCVQL